MAALGAKLSYSPGAKTFKMPLAPEVLLGPLSASKRKTTRELKKDGRDSRRATACAACGNPNDLKTCSGCGQRFYCGQACQKVRLHCRLEHGLTLARLIGNLLTNGIAPWTRSTLQVDFSVKICTPTIRLFFRVFYCNLETHSRFPGEERLE
jgi:hypothetical protein